MKQQHRSMVQLSCMKNEVVSAQGSRRTSRRSNVLIRTIPDDSHFYCVMEKKFQSLKSFQAPSFSMKDKNHVSCSQIMFPESFLFLTSIEIHHTHPSHDAFYSKVQQTNKELFFRKREYINISASTSTNAYSCSLLQTQALQST